MTAVIERIFHAIQTIFFSNDVHLCRKQISYTIYYQYPFQRDSSHPFHHLPKILLR